MIIFNHGYIPPDEYRTTERYVAYVDHMARHGYIVFRPDYRGHDQSEGVASGAYGSPDYVVDVLNAVAALRRLPEADPNRIGMWGHSMGGYITLRSMVIDPDIRAGVIWAGVVGSYPDLLNRWRRTPTPGPDGTPLPGRGWRGGLASIYGSPEENPAFWASISANSFLADLSGPVQLHHGTADFERAAPVLRTPGCGDRAGGRGGRAVPVSWRRPQPVAAVLGGDAAHAQLLRRASQRGRIGLRQAGKPASRRQRFMIRRGSLRAGSIVRRQRGVVISPV